MRKVDPAGCEVHRCVGGLDSAACRGWGVGEGKGRGSGEEGKTMELPKQPFSVHVAGVKQEYHRAKLSGARYFDVGEKFGSFWRLKLYSTLVRPTMISWPRICLFCTQKTSASFENQCLQLETKIVNSIRIWIIELVQANTIIRSNLNEIPNVFILNMMTRAKMCMCMNKVDDYIV